MNAKPQNCSPREIYAPGRIRCHPLVLMCSLIAVLAIGSQLSSLLASPVTEVVVKTGDKAPDGDGTFDLGLAGSLTAVLNNCGWAAFHGSLVNTTNGRPLGTSQPSCTSKIEDGSGYGLVRRFLWGNSSVV